MNSLDKVLGKIKNQEAVIGIIGLGYVGLPLALRFHDRGYGVVGLDLDQRKIDKLGQQESYIEHIKNDRLPAPSDKWQLSADYKSMGEVDAIILCVPTPLNKNREPDISYVTDTMDALKPFLREGQIVSLESTTYPGTTEEELLPRMEAGDLKVGETIFLVYSPEREDPGNKDFTTHTIPKIVGGQTKSCLQAGEALYNAVITHVVPVSSTQTAEMTKLLENIHRTVNIGLVNEMKIVCDRMGINVHEVIDAAATKPFGFTPYYPGPGLGGHCIPIDPFYLTWKAKEYGLSTRFIELSGEINRSMPRYVVRKLSEALNERQKPMKGSKVLILGIAYKKNVDDTRESPSVEIMELLKERGVIMHYSDPHVPKFPKMRDHKFDLDSVDLKSADLGAYDAVMILTDHDAYDVDDILKRSELIIDTRGVYARAAHLDNADVKNKVIKA